MSKLLSPVTLKSVTLKNRVVVSPMCQYSAKGGLANDWHFAHLARFALGGFGLVILEAAAVTPEGRITYADLGIWSDDHVAPLRRIVDFLHSQGAAAGIQLAHAGRKASTLVPWRGGVAETEAEKPTVGYEDWLPVGPSAICQTAQPSAFKVPHALDLTEIASLVDGFVTAAARANAAGFDVIELHGAHGYLLNQFLSPVSNQRDDAYGGSLENRMRFPLEVAAAVRAVWPAEKPLFVRLSVTDGAPGGWSVADSVVLCKRLKDLGVDVIDCSSGGFETSMIKAAPLYQVPLAAEIRRETGLVTMAVGLISDPHDAEVILTRGDADLIALGRTALDNPQWPLDARDALGEADASYAAWPAQAGYAVRIRDRVLGRRSFG